MLGFFISNIVSLRMDKIMVSSLCYTPETRQKLRSHILTDDDCDDFKYYYYLPMLLDLQNIESATPNDELWMRPGHSDVRMKTGDIFIIKISTIDLARMIDHISAEKYLCKLKN